jgi:hypothetical protein
MELIKDENQNKHTCLSTMIINKENHHMCGMKINMGNVNCHE